MFLSHSVAQRIRLDRDHEASHDLGRKRGRYLYREKGDD